MDRCYNKHIKKGKAILNTRKATTMELDRTIVREINKLIGNGSREAKFAMLKRIDAAKKDLSTTKIRDTFIDCLRKHGRAVVAVCVAATLDDRKNRIDCWGLPWAHKVLSLLPQNYLTPGFRGRACIEDGIHPTAICDYAHCFVMLTQE